MPRAPEAKAVPAAGADGAGPLGALPPAIALAKPASPRALLSARRCPHPGACGLRCPLRRRRCRRRRLRRQGPCRQLPGSRRGLRLQRGGLRAGREPAVTPGGGEAVPAGVLVVPAGMFLVPAAVFAVPAGVFAVPAGASVMPAAALAVLASASAAIAPAVVALPLTGAPALCATAAAGPAPGVAADGDSCLRTPRRWCPQRRWTSPCSGSLRSTGWPSSAPARSCSLGHRLPRRRARRAQTRQRRSATPGGDGLTSRPSCRSPAGLPQVRSGPNGCRAR